MPKGQPYSGELRQQVVEDVIKNHLGYNEAMRKYGIKGRSKIQEWERRYLEEGAESLYMDRRGRARTESGSRRGRPAKLDKQVEEDLLAEVQRLRAEVDYLKNMNALVFQRVQREKKHK